MDLRARFISDLGSCLFTMTELCAAYGISRKTGYKWAERYSQQGVEGLRDRPRAPLRRPGRTEARCEAALLEARRSWPDWGPRKLLAVLRKEHKDWPWPAVSTAGEILKRHGLVGSRARRRRGRQPARPLVEAEQANSVWAADFKGEFRTGDRQLCYPLTVTDLYSRYLLGCRGRRSISLQAARPVFEQLFSDYGLPRVILTDGGTPFSSPRSPRRLSRLSVWWVKLGIEPVVIQPAKPYQNGSHERMHRTLKQATARPPAATLWRQQMAFDFFRREFNEVRPHEALGMKTPSQLYRSSPRRLPQRPEDPSYPGHFELRRVRTAGEIKWRGKLLFLSAVLAGELVGLVETDEDLWSVYFGPHLLGRYEPGAETWTLL